MKPVLQALVLAERVYTDVSGKKIIAGTFNGVIIGSMPYPMNHEGGKVVSGGTDVGSPSLYLSLTDLIDETRLTVQFTSVSKNTVVLRTELMIECEDRLATVEIVCPLPPLRDILKEEGVYSVDVVWNEEILGSHRITAMNQTKG